LSDIANYFEWVMDVLPRVPQEQIEQCIVVLEEARSQGRRIFMLGNGGSSATASHFVNDMVKSVVQPGRPRFKLSCLSDNVPTMTAYANDVSYESVFAEPLAALAEPGDVVFAISGSGNSPNVLRAMSVAAEMGLHRLGLAGFEGGKLKNLCDVCVVVPSDSMQVIEDVHLVILHSIFRALSAPAL
jgi:D-sedoheptulose 7-phosphate isomerase